MTLPLIEDIKKRSREQWAAMLQDACLDARIWIQENGQKAFFVGLFLGIVVFALFRVVVTLLVLTALVFVVIWSVAEPEASKGSVTSDIDSDKSETAPDDSSRNL
ncbi:MAG: hypothetical protein KDD53_09755 [Bdellovibrionales bacterium]|nr:hypothetical protein [Bdellovibrionales bacterium]